MQQAKSSATALVDGLRVPVVAVVAYLASRWEAPDTGLVFRRAYAEYHNQCALHTAEEMGYIGRDLEDYDRCGELPEYVVGMYYHLMKE